MADARCVNVGRVAVVVNEATYDGQLFLHLAIVETGLDMKSSV